MIDEVNEILGKDFEIIIRYDIDDYGVKKLTGGVNRISLIDRTGAIGPYSYNSKSDVIDIDIWFKTLENSLKMLNYKHTSTYHHERIELLLSLMDKVKRIRKINKLLNDE